MYKNLLLTMKNEEFVLFQPTGLSLGQRYPFCISDIQC